MDTNAPQPTETQAPIPTDAELKMPEEQFGGSRQPSDAHSMLIPLLAGLLIVLVAALAILFFFRDTILEAIGMNSGAEDVLTETEAMPEEPAVKTTPELDQIQSELEATSFTDIEADFERIDAELTSGATTTAQ